MLWGRDAALVESLNRTHENANYLPGLALSAKIRGTTDLDESTKGAEVVVVATPSQATRDLLQGARG